eukprot:TRINITY_DN8384_c0_g1_i4.p1 TRINITY_DN8384_c0_g1~~TRINITY_DN8384_c0_g1_i4.p1  ORF type:complete len:183 (-),score=47.90 TRINITY_DN8384_c0_g1_i4:237-785(-)
MRELLHNADPQSTLFLAENERFDKDFAVYDKQTRELQKVKREIIEENHRIAQIEREQRKWDTMMSEDDRMANKIDYHREVLLAGKRNTNGMPYDPITLEYERSSKGEELRSKDDDSKVRAYLRAQNLDVRSNCGYNIMTGETRKGVDVPNNLQPKYDQAKDVLSKQNVYKFTNYKQSCITLN